MTETEKLTTVAKRLTSNCWDTYLGQPPRDWQKIVDNILLDGRLLAEHYLAAESERTKDRKGV